MRIAFVRQFSSHALPGYAGRPLISIDWKKKIEDQLIPFHNRWHPDIPAVASVEKHTPFRVDCFDCLGGQIGNNDSIQDIQKTELAEAHVLSGPIEVKGAKAGDVLVVDILDVGPFPHQMWGYTGILEASGFLAEHYPKVHKAIWDFSGVYATSRHITDVKFVGIPHPGVLGCAPSKDLLQRWNQREAKLNESDPLRRTLASPPTPERARLGKISKNHPDWQRIVREAARTIPPREHGGNCDIKNLTRGSRVFLPVYVDGANLSVGDLHFSQGDGEISFCGAIEMAGWVDLRVDIIKDGVSKLKMTTPIFQSSALEPKYSPYLTFEGISVDPEGGQHYLDATIAYRQACLNAIEYLKRYGYTGEQAYIILGTAPIDGRISGIVDIPNACCTVAVPTEIFDFDIRPGSEPHNKSRGSLPGSSKK